MKTPFSECLGKTVVVDWRSPKERADNPLTADEAITLYYETHDKRFQIRTVEEIRQFADGSYHGVDHDFGVPFPMSKVIL